MQYPLPCAWNIPLLAQLVMFSSCSWVAPDVQAVMMQYLASFTANDVLGVLEVFVPTAGSDALLNSAAMLKVRRW
jgi:hypothetical protein